MFRNINRIAGFIIFLGSFSGMPPSAIAADNNIIAINVALDPDPAMTEFAKTVNMRMLKAYPQGFALDDTHQPHITILQRYVRLDNLSAIIAAVDKLLAREKISSWRLNAIKYNFNLGEDKFLGSIAIEKHSDLLILQQKLIEAITPFTEKTGTSSAFFITAEEPAINPGTVDYVTTFVPERAGGNYLPHITLGFASKDCKRALTAKPFKPFTFSPAGVSMYQIGNTGTARKKLWEWR